MDVRCSTCDEPWDTHHLMHDEIFDTDLGEEEAIAWMDLPPTEKLSPWYRARFKANGWEFGSSILNVIHCPACPKDTEPDPEKVAIKAALEDVLGDDEDGLAAMLEDYGL
jgi:hypothetical protein